MGSFGEMAAIRSGESVPLMDLDMNDQVDAADLRIWVENLAGTWFGDANLDGSVNATDLNALALSWRTNTTSWAHGDFTADGKVDAADLNALALNWRRGVVAAPSVAAVPEPGALSVVGVAFAGVALLSRRKSTMCVSRHIVR